MESFILVAGIDHLQWSVIILCAQQHTQCLSYLSNQPELPYRKVVHFILILNGSILVYISPPAFEPFERTVRAGENNLVTLHTS